tara:strand:+ start:976 stop:1671 length:696 start_codon:yes stop_codon:yes gene_type:complete
MNIDRANWRLKLFSAFFLFFFLALSAWQVERGMEKADLLTMAEAQSNLPGQWVTTDLEVSNGEPVRIEGSFNPNAVLLLDNRVIAGRVGYEVLQVFEGENGVKVLVNRGFVAGARTRVELPDVPMANTARQLIRGHAYRTELSVPEENVLGDQSPWVVQVVKPEEMEKLVGQALVDFTVRLEEFHPDALPRYWPVTTMPPERHYGYAFTWFLMALAVVGVFIYTVRQTDID